MKANLFNIKGKVAMVTGARRGLGLAMATGLVEAGAKLVAVVVNRVNSEHAWQEK